MARSHRSLCAYARQTSSRLRLYRAIEGEEPVHDPQNSVYVDGEWVNPDSVGTIEVRNPSNADESVSEISKATRRATPAPIDPATAAQS